MFRVQITMAPEQVGIGHAAQTQVGMAAVLVKNLVRQPSSPGGASVS